MGLGGEKNRLTPMKQTNSLLQMVLLGLLMEGGQKGPLPLQKLASRHPLSSLHLSPNLSSHSELQHGPCNKIIIIIKNTSNTKIMW